MTKNEKKNNIINFPKKKSKVEREVEAIVFAADEPLDLDTIEKRVGSTSNIKKILENLQKDYSERGINLIYKSNKWSFRTAIDLSKLMSLQKSTQKKLSKSTIETLAIIVYHQPVTRSEIESIRGVAFSSNTYSTTEKFLEHFNIEKLTDLPSVDELSSAGLIDDASIDSSIFGTSKFFKEQSLQKKDDLYKDIDKAIKDSPKSEE